MKKLRSIYSVASNRLLRCTKLFYYLKFRLFWRYPSFRHLENLICKRRRVKQPKRRPILFIRLFVDFQLFYDADILEENVLLEWGDKVSKKFVSRDLNQEIHKAAEPFIKWLREAEEEDDSGEESEDDVEVSVWH